MAHVAICMFYHNKKLARHSGIQPEEARLQKCRSLLLKRSSHPTVDAGSGRRASITWGEAVWEQARCGPNPQSSLTRWLPTAGFIQEAGPCWGQGPAAVGWGHAHPPSGFHRQTTTLVASLRNKGGGWMCAHSTLALEPSLLVRSFFKKPRVSVVCLSCSSDEQLSTAPTGLLSRLTPSLLLTYCVGL